MILQLVMAFFATLSFSVLFNVPKGELLYGGACGAFGWLFYILITQHIGWSGVTATFFATITVTMLCRVLANIRKMPLTIFLVSGIIPLVPGAGIYNTMYSLIISQPSSALAQGITTFKIAGIIGVGIIVVLSLPYPGLVRTKTG